MSAAEPSAPLVVTQSARSAAGDYLYAQASPEMRALGAGSGVRAGLLDDHPLVQLVADAERRGLDVALQSQDLLYLLLCVETHADKFPVPQHMRGLCARVRALTLVENHHG